MFQNIPASLGNLDLCLASITFCYLCFLHSACLGQNCSVEAPSDPAKRVYPKNQTANQEKPTGGADPAALHLSFLK